VTFLLTPPSPLKCHVLFEWPLIVSAYTIRINFNQIKKLIYDKGIFHFTLNLYINVEVRDLHIRSSNKERAAVMYIAETLNILN
jgi:hypothetical protein